MPTEHNPGASVREWTDLVRRLRLGREVKGVVLMLATYADSDGTRVFPGAARLAVDCEVSYNYAADVIAFARKSGLIELVRPGNRRTRKADEYRLTIGIDVKKHIDVLSPTEQQQAIERARKAHGSVASEGSVGSLRVGRRKESVLPPAGDKTPGSILPTAGQIAVSVPSGAGQIETPGDPISPAPVGTLEPISPATVNGSVLPGAGPTEPSTPLTTTHRANPGDLEAAVTQSRASPPRNPESDPLPKRCPHGLDARLRADGTLSCALCRAGTRLAIEHPSAAHRIIQAAPTRPRSTA